MPVVTVAASTETHFTIDSILHPRTAVVQPHGAADARLIFQQPLGGSMEVSAGSTVGGSVPGSQAALIAALVEIVMAAGAGSAPQPVILEPGTTTEYALATAVTATGAQTGVAMPKGHHDYAATLSGTGAISCTFTIDYRIGASTWITGPSMTLSGTTSVSDADWDEASYAAYRVNVSAISGTGAALTVTGVA